MGKHKHTTESVINNIKAKYGSAVVIKDEENFKFKNVDADIICVCETHGDFVKSYYNLMKSKYGCGKCSPTANKGWNHKKQKLQNVHGHRYDYSLNNEDEYTSYKMLKIVCKKHGVFEQRYLDHLRGNGCVECYNESKLLTLNRFLFDSIKLHGDSYNYQYVFDDFESSQSKVRIVCMKHGTFTQIANDHRKGVGCPLCKNRSKGEKVIHNFLINNSIDFIPQKTFDGCLGPKGRQVRYDFYIPSKNVLIEYDGQQHETKMMKGKMIETNDAVKDQYAKNMNISLIRLNCSLCDIEKELKRFFVESYSTKSQQTF